MNALEFHKKMEKAMENSETTKDNVKETLEVVQQFCQELIDELSEVLSGKVSQETALVVADILRSLSEGYKKIETPEGMGLFMIYKLGLGREEETVKIEIPILDNYKETDDDEKEN